MRNIFLTAVFFAGIPVQSQDFDFGDIESDYSEESNKKDNCKIPFSDCWCDNHPNQNHPLCPDKVAAPIDSWLFILGGFGAVYGFKKTRLC